MESSRLLAILVGIYIVAVVWLSMLRTLVVARGSSRLVGLKDRAILFVGHKIAWIARHYPLRDRVLLWVAPLSIVSSLVLWLGLFFLGYGLVMYGMSAMPLDTAFREAGSSLATLGYAAGEGRNLTGLDFAAALTGPITIGLLVGYTPTMYSAYQRREAALALLAGRAGSPAWGPQVLARFAMVNALGELEGMWPEWEAWAADVAESHTNFPVLVHMRSAQAHSSWVSGLIAMMDAAALHLSLCPSVPNYKARLFLRQGITCLRAVADAERIPYDPDPSPDTPSLIDETEFGLAVMRLVDHGYVPEREAALAYPHFRGWRANYETLGYALADRTYAVPAPWTGPRTPPVEVIYPVRMVDRKPSGTA